MPVNRQDKTFFLLFCLFLLLVFANSLFNGFTYDDHEGIEESAFITSLRNLPRVFTRDYFKNTPEKSYRPVVTISYFLDHSIWGKRPFGYHLTNVILHLFSAILFYFFIGNFLEHKESRFVAALLFGLHPVVCEPVNAISFREDILAGMFVLAALNLFMLTGPRLKPLSLLHFIFAFLAYFSKESALPLLLVILCLMIVMKKEKGEDRSWTKEMPFLGLHLALLLFYIVIRFWVLVPGPEGKTRILGGSAWAAVSHSGFLFQKAWGMFLVPWNLNADYVFWDIKGIATDWGFVGWLFALLYIAVLILSWRRNMRPGFFAALWILLFFLPVSNILPLTNPFAERYLYLSLMGFAFLGGMCYDHFRMKYEKSGVRSRSRNLKIAAGIYLLLLAIISIKRNEVWRSDQTLWRATFRTEPRSIRALNGVALESIWYKDYKKAEDLFRKALSLDPLDYEIRNNLAVVYIQTNRPSEAIVELEKAVALKPDYAVAHYNLARLYLYKQGKDKQKARMHLDMAIKYGYPVPSSFLEKVRKSE